MFVRGCELERRVSAGPSQVAVSTLPSAFPGKRLRMSGT